MGLYFTGSVLTEQPNCSSVVQGEKSSSSATEQFQSHQCHQAVPVPPAESHRLCWSSHCTPRSAGTVPMSKAKCTFPPPPRKAQSEQRASKIHTEVTWRFLSPEEPQEQPGSKEEPSPKSEMRGCALCDLFPFCFLQHIQTDPHSTSLEITSWSR